MFSTVNDISLYNSNTGAFIQNLTGHGDVVLSVAFSSADASGNFYLVSGSRGLENNLKIWDPVKGIELLDLTEHTSNVNLVVFKNNATFASASIDDFVIIWEIVKESNITIKANLIHKIDFGQNGSSPSCLAFSSSNILAVGNGNDIKLFNIDTGEMVINLQGHIENVFTLAFNRDVLASGSMDKTVKIWSRQSWANYNIKTKNFTLSLDSQLTSYPTSLAFNSKNVLAIGFLAGDPVLVNPDTNGLDLYKTLTLNDRDGTKNTYVAFSRSGLLAIGNNSTVSIWNVT